MLESMLAYWRDFEKQSHYFDFHFCFEVLYFIDPRVRREWKKSRVSSHLPPHVLQESLGEEFTEEKMQVLLESSDVHKLTYKLSPEIVHRKTNFYTRICNYY
jgi:hypothetical protein